MEVEMGEINVKSVVATHTCTHVGQCIRVVVICPATHVKAEYSLTWEKAPWQLKCSINTQLRGGGEGNLEVNVCRKKFLEVNQHAARVGGAVWEAPTNIWQISMKYVQLHHNTVFNRVSNILKKIGVENLVIENILGDRKGEGNINV